MMWYGCEYSLLLSIVVLLGPNIGMGEGRPYPLSTCSTMRDEIGTRNGAERFAWGL